MRAADNLAVVGVGAGDWGLANQPGCRPRRSGAPYSRSNSCRTSSYNARPPRGACPSRARGGIGTLAAGFDPGGVHQGGAAHEVARLGQLAVGQSQQLLTSPAKASRRDGRVGPARCRSPPALAQPHSKSTSAAIFSSTSLGRVRCASAQSSKPICLSGGGCISF